MLKLVDRTSLSFVDASRRGSSPLSDIFVLSRGNIIRDYLWGGVNTSSSHNVHKLQAISGLFLLFCSAAKSSLRPGRRAAIPSKPWPIRIPSRSPSYPIRDPYRIHAIPSKPSRIAIPSRFPSQWGGMGWIGGSLSLLAELPLQLA